MNPAKLVLSLLAVVISDLLFAGGDPNYVLKVDAPNPGPPGSQTTARTLLDFPSGNAVSGVSYGVCHDPALLAINCTGGLPNDCIDSGIIVQGADLQATNGGDGAGFFAPATATAPAPGYTCGIVVNLLGGDSLPPTTDAELVLATYKTFAKGRACLSICETGSPLVLLSVGIAGGGDVLPETQDGCLDIQPPSLYTVRTAGGSGTVVDLIPGSSSPISTFLEFCHETTPDVSGVSYGVCHDPALLSINCTGGVPNDCIDNGIIVQGAEVQATNGGDGAGFFAPATATSPLVGYTCGIVINLLGGDVLPNTSVSEIAVATYEPRVPEGHEITTLEICETGEPQVLLSVGIAGGGDTVPGTDNGLVLVQVPPPVFFEYSVPDGVALSVDGEGVGSADLSISLWQEGAGAPVGPPALDTVGFSFGLRHTSDVVVDDAGNPPARDRGIRPSAVLMALNGGTGPEFFGPNADAARGPGITVGVVYNLLGGETLSFPEVTPVVDVTFRTELEPEQIGGEPIPVPLTFATSDDPLGNPPVLPGVVVSGSLSDPSLSFLNGRILIVFDNSFVRGDCNDDAIVNVADGIWILNELFDAGPVSGCREACDSNGDGTFDSSDAIFVFNYQFLDGPPPSAPFPGCDSLPRADCEHVTGCS